MTQIIYTDRNYVISRGCKPCEVPDELAQRLVDKGLAKYVNSQSAPIPLSNNIVAKQPEVKPETGWLNHFVWIQDTAVDQSLRVACDRVGFLVHWDTHALSNSGLFLADAIVIHSSSIPTTEENPLIKTAIFQKSIPHVLVLEDVIEHTLWTHQLMSRAHMRVIIGKNVFKALVKNFGGLVNPHILDSKKSSIVLVKHLAKFIGGIGE